MVIYFVIIIDNHLFLKLIMLLKNDFSIHEKNLANLKTLVGNSIKYIVASECWHQFHTDRFAFGSKVKILFDVYKEFSCLNLFSSPYIYNDIIGDEISNINLVVDNNEYFKKDNPTLLNYDKPFHGYLYRDDEGNSFVIKKIKIYGEKRTRKWSNFLIKEYFSLREEESISVEVSDYLFSKEYVVLENEKGKQLIFRSYHGNITLNFSGKVEIDKSDIRHYYYEKFELDKNYDEEIPFSSNEDMSNEVRLKLHYVIE